MATTPAKAPASAPDPAPSKIAAAVEAVGAADAPFWWPQWPIVLAIGLYSMAFWLLYILAPARGEDPSELFKTLATAVVMTGFLGGPVAVAYAANRDSQKKNETIAAQAKVIASQTTTGP